MQIVMITYMTCIKKYLNNISLICELNLLICLQNSRSCCFLHSLSDYELFLFTYLNIVISSAEEVCSVRTGIFASFIKSCRPSCH